MVRLFLLALLLPSPAAALSCLVPNLGLAFNERAEDAATWIVARGTFEAPEHLPTINRHPAPVERDGMLWSVDPEGAAATFGFEGVHVGARADVPLATPVEVAVTCAGPWCGAFPEAGRDTLLLLRRMGDGYAATFGACPWGWTTQPTAAQMEAMRACLAAGHCGADEIATLGPPSR